MIKCPKVLAEFVFISNVHDVLGAQNRDMEQGRVVVVLSVCASLSAD